MPGQLAPSFTPDYEASMLNKVMIIGRLGADPELRYSQSGTPMTNLSVATDESYTDKDGNRQERTEWHRVAVFQRQAETCSQYLSKGSLVFVEGRLQTRKWTDQQGQDRYTTEIRADRVQFLDRKSDRPGAGAGGGSYGDESPRQAPPRKQQGNAPQRNTRRNDMDEDLGPAFPSEASSMDDMPF